MRIISYGDPSIQSGRFSNETLMAGRHKCSDCDYDEDDCRRDCFDCGRYGYPDDDCGCDDGADCNYDD